MRPLEAERWKAIEWGSGTRRRLKPRDYAAAKDAECGKKDGENAGGRMDG